MENSFGWKLGAEGSFSCLKVEKHRGFYQTHQLGPKTSQRCGTRCLCPWLFKPFFPVPSDKTKENKWTMPGKCQVRHIHQKIMVFTPQKKTWQWKSQFLIEDASSNGPFSIVMLVSRGVLHWWGKSSVFQGNGGWKIHFRMLRSSIQNLGYSVNVPDENDPAISRRTLQQDLLNGPLNLSI